MKRKLNSKFRLIAGLVTILIGILLTFAQGTGAYVLVGVGCGYVLTAFMSEDKMADTVEKIVTNPDMIFFRLFQLMTIALVFKEGNGTIGILALVSMISLEMIWKKSNKKNL